MSEISNRTPAGISPEPRRSAINTHLFSQIGLDSGALTQLGTVGHQISRPGTYNGTVMRGEEIRAYFAIDVDKSSTVRQLNVDLASLDDPLNKCGRKKFAVSPDGIVLFHISKGAGGYYVKMTAAGDGNGVIVFDSRTLDKGDVFIASVLRPGQYGISNAMGKQAGKLEVPYPVAADVASARHQPVNMKCTGKGFEPGEIHAKVSQPLVFQMTGPSRITLALSAPIDPAESSRLRLKGFMKQELLHEMRSRSMKAPGSDLKK